MNRWPCKALTHYLPIWDRRSGSLDAACISRDAISCTSSDTKLEKGRRAGTPIPLPLTFAVYGSCTQVPLHEETARPGPVSGAVGTFRPTRGPISDQQCWQRSMPAQSGSLRAYWRSNGAFQCLWLRWFATKHGSNQYRRDYRPGSVILARVLPSFIPDPGGPDIGFRPGVVQVLSVVRAPSLAQTMR